MVCRVFAEGISLLLMAACASPNNDDRSVVHHYACDAGARFSAHLQAHEAVVTTEHGTYRLQRRPGSIGVRFGAGEVAFVQDEERAVLIGAGNGPYRNCLEVGSTSATGS